MHVGFEDLLYLVSYNTHFQVLADFLFSLRKWFYFSSQIMQEYYLFAASISVLNALSGKIGHVYVNTPEKRENCRSLKAAKW